VSGLLSRYVGFIVAPQETEFSADATVISLSKAKAAKQIKAKKFKPAWFAAAASVMLGTFFAINLISVDGPDIAGELVSHIHTEPDLLVLTESITNDEKVRMVLKQTNMSFAEGEVEVLAAKLCPVDGKLAAHLVVKGETGNPVTLFVMPGNNVEAKEFKTSEFNGRVLSADNGTIAMLGGKQESLDKLEVAVASSFQWLN